MASVAATTQWSTSISDYSLFERVGRGAFGDVFRAAVAGTDGVDSVALKVMNLEKIGSSPYRIEHVA